MPARARRSERPVVPPPPVGNSEDGTVVVRRAGRGAEAGGEDEDRGNRIARRLARQEQPPANQGANGTRPNAAPSEERVWHGPGSGDPAPPVRIRADLAAAASANAEGTRRTRRSAGRDRPLRAR